MDDRGAKRRPADGLQLSSAFCLAHFKRIGRECPNVPMSKFQPFVPGHRISEIFKTQDLQ